MSVASLCEICQRARVRHTCGRCAQLVCDDHFDESSGHCAECAAELGGGGRGRQPRPGGPDGVDTYQF